MQNSGVASLGLRHRVFFLAMFGLQAMPHKASICEMSAQAPVQRKGSASKTRAALLRAMQGNLKAGNECQKSTVQTLNARGAARHLPGISRSLWRHCLQFKNANSYSFKRQSVPKKMALEHLSCLEHARWTCDPHCVVATCLFSDRLVASPHGVLAYLIGKELGQQSCQWTWDGIVPTPRAGPGCVKEKKQCIAAGSIDSQCNPCHKHRVDAPPSSKKRKEADPSESDLRSVPVKRLRRKTPCAVAMGYQPDAEVAEGALCEEAEDFFVLRCDPVDKGDPRRRKEGKVLALSKHISLKPTLPWQLQSLGPEKEAYDLPAFHCSLKGCDFVTENEEELQDHITSNHAKLFAEIGGERQSRQGVLQMYAEAITRQCQSGAPVANVSIDRRALRGYRSSVVEDGVACLLCFVCARKYPYVKASSNQQIGWVQPVDKKNQTLFGQSLARADAVLGFCAFKEKYVDTATAFAQQEMKEELETWSCEAQCLGQGVKLVCCPEDKVCQKRCAPEKLCSQCWVPLCRDCRRELVWHGKQPAAALSNDMMVYYGPRNVYSTETTVMEMLCASPCLTTMICFSLEQRLRGDRALDQDAWRNRQRMACRGNATTFPLAWEDLLQQLKGLKEKSMGQQSEQVVLPHSGRRLSEIVSVIVKSHQKQGTVDVGRILHQARVRRAVVVQLIEDAVARGHPAFEGVNMQAMYSAAEALPEDAVPLEVIAELPYDNELDRIMRQKAATPVRQEMAGEELAEEM